MRQWGTEASRWIADFGLPVLGFALLLLGGPGRGSVPVLIGYALVGLAALQWVAGMDGYAVPRFGRSAIQTWGCWEQPLAFTVRRRGKLLLFSRRYDESAQEYSRDYRVHELLGLSDNRAQAWWAELPDRAARPLGTVPAAEVRVARRGCSYIPTAVIESVLKRTAVTAS